VTESTGATPTTTFDFHDKVAIVTGSAGGIGQAYAGALAAAGASVVVADINADKAEAVAVGIRSHGGSALGVAVDVADPASAQGMAQATVDEFGGIDYLVNNAAIFGGMKLDLLLTVPQPVPIGEHARRPQLRPGLLAGHEGPWWRRHRQPVLDRRLHVRRFLRAG
jgi:NAD(P)-dependent dehydrogenase (short-subunit alcohol dehydrogenase family)